MGCQSHISEPLFFIIDMIITHVSVQFLLLSTIQEPSDCREEAKKNEEGIIKT
jgi:hypothetical protein